MKSVPSLLAAVLSLLALASSPAFASDAAEAPGARKAFLEALNAVESFRVHACVDGATFPERKKTLETLSGVRLAVSPEAAETLDLAERRRGALYALRDRLRFTRGSFEWEGVPIRDAVAQIAKKHGFEAEFEADALALLKAAAIPAEVAALERKVRSTPVSLALKGATVEEAAAELAKAGGIRVQVARAASHEIRTDRRTLILTDTPLDEALRWVARLYGMNVGVSGGGFLFMTTEAQFPWEGPPQAAITLRAETSTEDALRKALAWGGLALGNRDGKWTVEVQRGDAPRLPWDVESRGKFRTDSGSPATLAVALELESVGLGIGFPDGVPTIMPAERARGALPVSEAKYAISFLKGSPEDFPGQFPDLRARGDSGPAVLERGDTYSAQAMREAMADYCRSLMERGVRGGEGDEMETAGGVIRVRTTPDVHEKLEGFLGQVRTLYKRSISVSFHFLRMDAVLLQKLLGSGRLSWGSLSPEQLAMIDRGVAGGEAVSVKRASLVAFNGQAVNSSAIRQVTHVADYDVEVAQAAQIGDPIVAVIREGLVAEVVPVLFGDGQWVLLDLQTAVSKIVEPMENFRTPHGDIALPKVDFQRISTSLFVKDGGAVLVGGTGSAGIGKDLVLLLQVNVERDKASPPTEAGPFHHRQVRVYDIRDLTHKVPDNPGPEVGITVASADAAGAAFCESEDVRVGEKYEPDEVVQLVRERISPESWDEGGNSAGLVLGYLVVVNTKDVLERVEALLEDCRQRRMKGVEVVTRFLSLKAADLDRILGEGGRRSGSAEISAERVEKLLEAAGKDKEAVLSATVFPLLNKQRAALSLGRQLPYICDVDVEVAQNAAVTDPVTGRLLEGVFLDYRAEVDPGEGEVTLVIRPTLARLKKMGTVDIGQEGEAPGKGKDEKKEEGKEGDAGRPFKVEGRIMLPELELQKIRTTISLANGSSVLVFCPSDAGSDSGRDLVILVTARLADGSKK